MNARQTKKKLKQQISKLESDNHLMKRIIADSPTMQELYDVYCKPVLVTYASMQIQEYRAKRRIPPFKGSSEIIELEKHSLAMDLFREIEDAITYTFDTVDMPLTITASIFIGRK